MRLLSAIRPYQAVIYKLIKTGSFIILLLSLSIFALGQSKERQELEKKRRQKEEEIKLTKKLLEETGKKQKETTDYLNILKNQIETREGIIMNIREELSYLDEEINNNRDVINSLNKDLDVLKKEYESMVKFAYKTRNPYNKLGFILSAETFNQSFKRMKLLQSYSEYRKKQMELIKQTQSAIEKKLVELDAQKIQKMTLLGIQNREKENLDSDRQNQSKVMDNLKRKEVQLKKDLVAKEKARKQIDKQIEDLIRAEIEKSKKASGTTTLELTGEAKQLSLDFTTNRGKLPWPVERGVITERFGQHDHPTLEGVVVVCNGIKIMSTKGAEARAVFGGKVSNVISIPGMGKSVIINHGEYFTVYVNLDEVYVKPNDKVSTKQRIGSIHYDQKSGKTEMELQIWKQSTKLDPEYWLFRK